MIKLYIHGLTLTAVMFKAMEKLLIVGRVHVPHKVFWNPFFMEMVYKILEKSVVRWLLCSMHHGDHGCTYFIPPVVAKWPA